MEYHTSVDNLFILNELGNKVAKVFSHEELFDLVAVGDMVWYRRPYGNYGLGQAIEKVLDVWVLNTALSPRHHREAINVGQILWVKPVNPTAVITKYWAEQKEKRSKS